MDPVVINVELKEINEKDYLIFSLPPKDNPTAKEISVDLTSEDGQKDLVRVFSALLEKMLGSSIRLELSYEEGYSKALFKEVCQEYIDRLNSEIQKVYEDIKEKIE